MHYDVQDCFLKLHRSLSTFSSVIVIEFVGFLETQGLSNTCRYIGLLGKT